MMVLRSMRGPLNILTVCSGLFHDRTCYAVCTASLCSSCDRGTLAVSEGWLCGDGVVWWFCHLVMTIHIWGKWLVMIIVVEATGKVGCRNLQHSSVVIKSPVHGTLMTYWCKKNQIYCVSSEPKHTTNALRHIHNLFTRWPPINDLWRLLDKYLLHIQIVFPITFKGMLLVCSVK